MDNITLAYSPDTDDAYMVHALKDKIIDWGNYHFEFIKDDIQELNRRALSAQYDITAISFATYPQIADSYWLCSFGASIGDRFGPVVVVKEESKVRTIADLRNQKIAIPGRQTSAFFAASELLPEFSPVETSFADIATKIEENEVTAGILIHELQLDYQTKGLRKIADLGQLWYERFRLPLPLGAIVIRRNLGETKVKELAKMYLKSVEWAIATDPLDEASSRATVQLNDALARRYIEMYVNADSLSLSRDVEHAMDRLFDIGYRRGLCPSLLKTQDVILRM